MRKILPIKYLLAVIVFAVICFALSWILQKFLDAPIVAVLLLLVGLVIGAKADKWMIKIFGNR